MNLQVKFCHPILAAFAFWMVLSSCTKKSAELQLDLTTATALESQEASDFEEQLRKLFFTLGDSNAIAMTYKGTQLHVVVSLDADAKTKSNLKSSLSQALQSIQQTQSLTVKFRDDLKPILLRVSHFEILNGLALPKLVLENKTWGAGDLSNHCFLKTQSELKTGSDSRAEQVELTGPHLVLADSLYLTTAQVKNNKKPQNRYEDFKTNLSQSCEEILIDQYPSLKNYIEFEKLHRYMQDFSIAF